MTEDLRGAVPDDDDWWRPVGAPGRLEVRELLSSEVWASYFDQDQGAELDLASARVVGRPLDIRARRLSRSVHSHDRLLAELDLSGAPEPTGGFTKSLWFFGRTTEVVLHRDAAAGSRLRGPLRYLLAGCGDRTWVWHFEGGRSAGERLVLSAGVSPRTTEPLVETFPASQGRALGHLRGGAGVDTHVTTWRADATPAEIVLAELLATSRLDGLVDYRATRVVGGIGELVDLLPRAEPAAE